MGYGAKAEEEEGEVTTIFNERREETQLEKIAELRVAFGELASAIRDCNALHDKFMEAQNKRAELSRNVDRLKEELIQVAIEL